MTKPLPRRRAEANDIIDQARGRAEVQRASVMEAAEADVAELRATAAAELADARASAVGSLREQVASVAVGAASSVVGRPIDQAAARSTIDRVLDGSEA